MVYSNTYGKRKPRYVRNRSSNKKPKVSKAVKQYVRRTVPKVETKELWIHSNEQQLNSLTQGTQTGGPFISQGTGADQRIGNVIHANRLHVKGVFNNNSTSESIVRMMVVGFDSTNGDPTLNLFRNGATGATAGVSAVNGLDAMYFPLNQVDLHIYHDKLVRLAGSVTGNAGANVQVFQKTIPLYRKRIEYKANTVSFGNQSWQYSVIYIIADSNDDTSTGTVVELSSLLRFYFTDA